LNATTWILVGALWILFGAIAALRWKGTAERSRPALRLFAKLGIRPASDRAYELAAAWAGAVAVLAGIVCIAVGLVMVAVS